jgi:hypothetical protein
MSHTHRIILGNISDNYAVLGGIFYLFDKFYEKRSLKGLEFVIKLLRFGCAMKNIRTKEQACSN